MNIRDFTLISGCMFSGKTTKLIEFYAGSICDDFEKIAIKPLLDTRYAPHLINAHSGLQLPGHRVSKPEEINTIVGDSHREVYIDEVQFFHPHIYQVIIDLYISGKRIYAAGLDRDSNGDTFGAMAELKTLAGEFIYLKAKCQVCGNPAEYTFRKAESTSQVLVGHADLYEARCQIHWAEGNGI